MTPQTTRRAFCAPAFTITEDKAHTALCVQAIRDRKRREGAAGFINKQGEWVR